MANKTVNIRALSMMLVVLLVGAFFQTGEALSDCGKGCMPVCLAERGATIPMCEIACEDYCRQISAEDSNFGFSDIGLGIFKDGGH
ncbi:hypothetical protein G4B88_020523 [Cannabis sativa]|uniref:Uncharacterized protein n=1 Tax=Cannabis sativa TaxID=3483 RepID=A0A7J6FMK4_CANSA|nr:hypothetical protein G4B88_003008 [Cannabis sativa]KAF4374131.1 hypothetical protein G4B88_020523 [Cannabis sativa]